MVELLPSFFLIIREIWFPISKTQLKPPYANFLKWEVCSLTLRTLDMTHGDTIMLWMGGQRWMDRPKDRSTYI